MLKQARVFVKGDVIGVGFRAWTKIQAKMNKITGWVRNSYYRPEIFGNIGGVEAVLQGEEANVNQILTKIKEGPVGAMVSDLEVMWEEPKEIFDTFEIIK